MQVCLDVLETIGTQREFGILSSFGCAAIAAAKIKELRDDPAVQAAISDKVVARQAREIYDLTDRLTDYEKSATKIRNILYCIGGPLNDNKQGYTRQQLKPFLDIANLVDVE